MQRELFILHIGKHTAKNELSPENHVLEIGDHLKWDLPRVRRISQELLSTGVLRQSGDYYLLTAEGQTLYTALCKRYYI